MGKHMIVYHVAIPVVVFVAALAFGAPVATGLYVAMIAGCASMMLMMVTGGGHHDHQAPDQRTGETQPEEREDFR